MIPEIFALSLVNFTVPHNIGVVLVLPILSVNSWFYRNNFKNVKVITVVRNMHSGHLRRKMSLMLQTYMEISEVLI